MDFDSALTTRTGCSYRLGSLALSAMSSFVAGLHHDDDLSQVGFFLKIP